MSSFGEVNEDGETGERAAMWATTGPGFSGLWVGKGIEGGISIGLFVVSRQ